MAAPLVSDSLRALVEPLIPSELPEPRAGALLALPPEARKALADVLMDLYRDAKAKAERR